MDQNLLFAVEFEMEYQEEEIDSLQFKEIPLTHTTEIVNLSSIFVTFEAKLGNDGFFSQLPQNYS